jgi:hypothetical protein
MTLRRARSLDALAADAAALDATFTADPPTALALDRRAVDPRVGRIAGTPRGFVTGQLRVSEFRQLTEAVTDATALTWATAAPAVRAVLSCWEHTGEVERITRYSGYDTGPIRSAVEVLSERWSSYRGRMTPIGMEEVGVIAPEMFTALDRELLGGTQQTCIPLFDGEAAPMPTLRTYPSMTAIVEATLRVIDAAGAQSVGVVLSGATPYQPLLESALASVGIPFAGGDTTIADADTRLCIRLFELAFVDPSLRCRWLDPVAAALEEPLPAGLRTWRIDAAAELTEPPAIIETLAHLRSLSTTAAIAHMEELLDVELGDCRIAAERTGVAAAPISASGVARMRRYLRALGGVTAETDGGVLLVEATSSMTVDRPVVCYLGLGPTWAATPPSYPWIDAERLLRSDRLRFERLLQQGSQRFYFVQHRRGGEPVLPCPHFQSIDPALTRFAAFETTPGRPHPRATPASPFESPADGGGGYVPSTLSNSKLRQLVVSPQSYVLGKVLDAPPEVPMRFGSVFHDLAEIRVSRPEVYTAQREALLDAAVADLAPIVPSAQLAFHRTRLQATLMALEAFLERYPPATAPPTDVQDPYYGNDIAEAMGIELPARVTERAFVDYDVGARGVIDLVCADGAVVDYKTGRRKEPSDVRKAARMEAIDGFPDYQALLYLDAMRRRGASMPIRMRFAYLTQAVPAIVRGEAIDIEDYVTEVVAVDEPYPRWARSEDAFAQLTGYADSNPRVKVLSKLEYETFERVLTEHPMRSPLVDPDGTAATAEALLATATETIGAYQYVTQGVERIMRDLRDPAPYIFTDELDAVRSLIGEEQAALRGYHADGFPPWGPRVRTPPKRYVDHRDCMLTGEGF